MGVGIILLQRDRLSKLATASSWRLSACSARPRLFQALHVLRRGASARSKAASASVVAAEIERARCRDCRAPRMVRRQREHGVEIGERLRVAAEARERGAAIETSARRGEDRAPAPRRSRQAPPAARSSASNALPRLSRASRSPGRIASALSRHVERLGVALERVQHVGEIDPARRARPG